MCPSWASENEMGKTAPEGWIHPEAEAQDVPIRGKRKRNGFDLARVRKNEACALTEAD
jgi:hypothetical protein